MCGQLLAGGNVFPVGRRIVTIGRMRNNGRANFRGHCVDKGLRQCFLFRVLVVVGWIDGPVDSEAPIVEGLALRPAAVQHVEAVLDVAL